MSSVRLRIVINSSNGTSARAQARSLMRYGAVARTGSRTFDELLRMWDELVVLLRRVWEELSARMRRGIAAFGQYTRETFCGVRGHDDRMRAEPNHLALECGRCGRVTSGWELTSASRTYASPSRHHVTQPGPRYFQLVRRS